MQKSSDEIEDAMTSPSEQPGMSRGAQDNELPGIPAETSFNDSEAAGAMQPECMEVDGGTFQALIFHTDSRDRPPGEEQLQSIQGGLEGRPSMEHLIIDSPKPMDGSTAQRLPVRHQSAGGQSEITQDERHITHHSSAQQINHTGTII
jgi:hypothetical protein